MFKKLGIEADKLEGLLVQAVCHAPPTLDQAAFNQLITAAILSKGNKKPTLTFVGQVIINASQQSKKQAWETSPFVYRVSDPPEPSASYPGHTLCPCQLKCVDHRPTWSTVLVHPVSTVGEPVTDMPTAHTPPAWPILILDQHHLHLIVTCDHLLRTNAPSRRRALTTIASAYCRFNSLSGTHPKKS
ncbi:hypothetical protein O181_006741 [Austropuccinia psidii MF-1]|uniref:Uncharacterized protein n=1 Tax=Austropuccinia psidii MF-1 TaxID=1389203 RepID=A0A9Q3BJM2_9BASI|nr:hypothetical protein [Austropuccinia psidii MF-1]